MDLHEVNELKDINPPCLKTREEVLCTLGSIIDESKKKTDNGRIRDPESDKIRIQYLRTAIMACSAFLAGFKDLQMDTIESRLSLLEAA